MIQFQSETLLKRLDDNVWAIEQDMVRCFLVVGAENALLFDTGAAPCDLPKIIRTVTDKPVILVQSHGDGDHTANSALFPEVFAHPREHEIILRWRPTLAGRLRSVKEGDAFDLGGVSLEVLETPGHTPGSISLLDRERRILYAGDTISYGPVFLFGPHRDIRTYRKTLDKLWDMDSYDTVYPCHNTCPIPKSVLPDLMAVVDGVRNGSITGTDMEGPPLPNGEKPLFYQYGSCGILYLPE